MSNADAVAAIHRAFLDLAQRYQDECGIQVTDVNFTWTDATSLGFSNRGIVVGVSMKTRVGMTS